MLPGTGPGSASTNAEAKEKKRALPSEFERQVEQIRNDIKTVRGNLDEAERVLRESEAKAVGVASSSAAGSMPISSMQTTGTTQQMMAGHVMQGNIMSEGVISENALGGSLMGGGNIMHGDILSGDLMPNE